MEQGDNLGALLLDRSTAILPLSRCILYGEPAGEPGGYHLGQEGSPLRITHHSATRPTPPQVARLPHRDRVPAWADGLRAGHHLCRARGAPREARQDEEH